MKLAWAVSGQGMVARAVMEAHLAGFLQTSLAMVISGDTAATGSMADYCSGRGIDFEPIDPGSLEDRMLSLQRAHRFDCMGLTFNRLIPASVIDAFGGRIFNLHLSLLPMFPGFGATKKALRSGASCTGVTVHFIDTRIDAGPVIASRKVAIEATDDENTLGRRQFEAAVPLVLQTVRLIERGLEPRFDLPDADLLRFSAVYCAAVPMRDQSDSPSRFLA